MTRPFPVALNQTGAPGSIDERRREPRIPAGAIPARLRAGEGGEPIAAHVLDISTSGLRVRVNRPLEPGTEATIWFDLTVATGQVRYCRENRAGLFEAGLCLTDAMSIV
ncbi:MAG TPA: PilZ domain-containing protein [Bryobacteraceae bacterium]|nr:PilZ domain-containing protein [Bryobacteraceae bacterium]